MRQRVRLNRSRKNGLVATVSARALNVASFISFSGLVHQLGTRPHRMGTRLRSSCSKTIVSMVSVGQTL